MFWIHQVPEVDNHPRAAAERTIIEEGKQPFLFNDLTNADQRIGGVLGESEDMNTQSGKQEGSSDADTPRPVRRHAMQPNTISG